MCVIMMHPSCIPVRPIVPSSELLHAVHSAAYLSLLQGHHLPRLISLLHMDSFLPLYAY